MLSISGDSVRHQCIVVSTSNAAQTILNKNEILTYFNRRIGVFPMDRGFSDDYIHSFAHSGIGALKSKIAEVYRTEHK